MNTTGSVVVAVAQLDFIPAFSDAGRHLLSEPDYTPFAGPSTPTLFDLQVSMRSEGSWESGRAASAVADWRNYLRTAYVNHMREKLTVILELARAKSVDVLVFPEYSLPCEVLPVIPELLPSAVVIAGSHIVEEECRERCGRIGFEIQEHDVGMAICPVFAGRERHTVHKLGPSRWEPNLVPGRRRADPIIIERDGTDFAIDVRVCIDFLAVPLGGGRGVVIAAVPAYTPDTTADFDNRALEYAKRKDHVVAIANAAVAGGSRIYYNGDTAGLPMQDSTGTWRATAGEEVLIAARIAAGSRSTTFRAVPTQPHAREQVAVVPLMYPSYNEQDRAVCELQSAAPHDVPKVLSAHRSAFSALRGAPTMREKIAQLGVRHGSLNHDEVRRFSEAVLFPDGLPTLDEWRYRALLGTARHVDELARAYPLSLTKWCTQVSEQFRNAAMSHSAALPFSLQQVEPSIGPGDFFAPWLTSATRLLALPGSGELDSELARWAAESLPLHGVEAVRRAGDLVAAARPYPVSHFWRRIRALLDTDPSGRLASEACRTHNRLKIECGRSLVSRAVEAKIVRSGQHYLLYGFSRSVLDVLRAYAAPEGFSLRLSVAECRNRLDVDLAPDLIAWLRELDPQCSFVSNVSLGAYLERVAVDAVFIGAHAILPDGILNTGGSLALAMLARHFRVPFIVVAASYKLWGPAVWEAERPHVVQMKRPETGPQSVGTTSVAAEINYAYDVIPMELVYGLVSDAGVFMPPGDISTLLSQDGSDRL